MKISNVTLELFAWDDIPATSYGSHTGRFVGRSDWGWCASRRTEGIRRACLSGLRDEPRVGRRTGLIRHLKPLLIGNDPLDRERLNQALWRRVRSATVRSIGALDVALWDLAGKAFGQPIHRLLGTFRDRIPAYASSAVLDSPQAYAQALQFRDTGWAAYKIHPPTRWKEDIKVCEAVRRAVGDYTIMLDSTWSYDYPAAIRVGRAVEEMGFYWYEDPLADQDIYNYTKLKQQLSIPIMATEYPQTGLELPALITSALLIICVATWP
jgi:L-alanine-DL-glutamate epimerase-like enolase superfamily enzyme